MSFGDLKKAQQFRDVIREIARREINLLRPKASHATVTSIDTVAGKCMVQFPGDTESVPVRMYSIQPGAVGAIVRVEGSTSLRYVTDVISGQAVMMLQAPNGNRYRVSVSNTGTLSVVAV